VSKFSKNFSAILDAVGLGRTFGTSNYNKLLAVRSTFVIVERVTGAGKMLRVMGWHTPTREAAFLSVTDGPVQFENPPSLMGERSPVQLANATDIQHTNVDRFVCSKTLLRNANMSRNMHWPVWRQCGRHWTSPLTRLNDSHNASFFPLVMPRPFARTNFSAVCASHMECGRSAVQE
jgi:hypothetical protein